MKNFLEEFKEFAIKGNVLDMAVGVVIGGAFGAIVTSLVNDIITPLISLVLGSANFDSLKIQLNAEASLNYGSFIQAIINFVIIAFSIFLAIKAINKFKKQEIEEDVEEDIGPSETELLEQILAELKNK
ncbi:large-conductance mechanosensitive channel protein MscL [Erysipelothrix urinaevulpis]|uniref:large-conductance mechanosensitive channel protein MscL n=1 Tax=Erysipelothrix urinaevulpis TaxID=2683717 RepID=UPI0013579AA1|nr:large-conductance mechanosensitive channel protein MscL [Erysipelothrix urinaevulpis]